MQTWRRGLVGIGVWALGACGGGASGGGTTPPPPPPPPPPSANVTLTLISDNQDQGDAGQLYAFIGDAPITRASMRANLNENAPALRYAPGVARATVTLQVPRGKTVTVIAIESNTNGFTPVVSPTPVRTRAPDDYYEFRSWIGDFASAPEPGVAVLTADRDKTLTATWSRQAGMAFRQLGCTNKKIQLNGPGLLTFGATVPDSAPDLTSRNAFTSGARAGPLQTEHDDTYLYAKQGTTITLRGHPDILEDRAPQRLRSGFMRWDGWAARCGANLVCQVPIPRADSAALVPPIRMISGFSVTTLPSGNVFGCNCIPGQTNPPCQQLP
ncbi:MAG: hypothetical protein JNJ98_12145 [Gemmatimonadetes bacterium]|nr:hypothetical protein [Gemmatimonadota bacterium]